MLQRLNTVKEEYKISVKFISLEMHYKKPLNDIIIEWKRGNTKKETKNTFMIDPENPIAMINENLETISVFYKIKNTNQC